MVYETELYTVEVGTWKEDKEPLYLVRSKKYGVIEFTNSGLYFVRDWADQMTKALEEQDKEYKEEPESNVLPFPGGDGRTN